MRAQIAYPLVMVVCLTSACRLPRPNVAPARMIEPRLLEPQLPQAERLDSSAPNALEVRLLSTLSLGHIGRRMLHLQTNGELIEDQVWRWSSEPTQYLDTAVRMELAANPRIRLLDAGPGEEARGGDA